MMNITENINSLITNLKTEFENDIKNLEKNLYWYYERDDVYRIIIDSYFLSPFSIIELAYGYCDIRDGFGLYRFLLFLSNDLIDDGYVYNNYKNHKKSVLAFRKAMFNYHWYNDNQNLEYPEKENYIVPVLGKGDYYGKLYDKGITKGILYEDSMFNLVKHFLYDYYSNEIRIYNNQLAFFGPDEILSDKKLIDEINEFTHDVNQFYEKYNITKK